MTYHHTQPGTLVLVICLIVGAIGVVISRATGHWMPAVLTVLIAAAIAVLFGSLTVEVSDSELRWHFGPGLLNYQLARGEIRQVGEVRNTWSMGWGIRMAPGFRLYNVSGLDAVELKLKSNEVLRIGTDDPQGLTAALQSPHGK